ncbi:MAG: hypothetical protein LIP03_16190 [Bacteroidales bacterium]|nr:hypothetical protein [Bacteroidales bacterium]
MKRICLSLLLGLVAVAMSWALTYPGLYQDFRTNTSTEGTITFDFSWIEVVEVAQPWSYNVYVVVDGKNVQDLWFNSGSHYQYQAGKGADSRNIYMMVPSGPDPKEYMMVSTTIEPMNAEGTEEAAILEVHFIDAQGQEIARFSRAWTHDLAMQLYQSLNNAIGMVDMQPYQE